MKVTKIGHCAMLIDVKGIRVLTDPGRFTSGQDDLKNINIVLITHEHGDHLHIDSLHKVRENNPNVVIITNASVGEILKEEEVDFVSVSDGEENDEHGVLIEGFGNQHAKIFGDFGLVENTGYFINNQLFYPGDAFTNPGKPVSVLAVPIAGPWMALKEAIDYVNNLKPKMCFPVHDGVLSDFGKDVHHRVLAKNISRDIGFIPLADGGEVNTTDN